MRPQVPDLTTRYIFDSQATWVTGVLGLFSECVIHGYLYNQALADVRSTGVGTGCLYCSSSRLVVIMGNTT